MVVNEEHRWEAPGTLELVRAFLNTGLPSAGPEDRLLDLRADPEGWAAIFPGLPRPAPRQLAELVELRSGLRRLLGATLAPADATWLTDWFERTGLGVRAGVEGEQLAVRLARRPWWRRLRPPWPTAAGRGCGSAPTAGWCSGTAPATPARSGAACTRARTAGPAAASPRCAATGPGGRGPRCSASPRGGGSSRPGPCS